MTKSEILQRAIELGLDTKQAELDPTSTIRHIAWLGDYMEKHS